MSVIAVFSLSATEFRYTALKWALTAGWSVFATKHHFCPCYITSTVATKSLRILNQLT